MLERGETSTIKEEHLKNFAQRLANWDNRIADVFLFTLSKNRAYGHQQQLICVFDPEPPSETSGFVSVINLLIRDDEEKASERLGLGNQFDLGFVMNDMVHLSNGEVVNQTGSKSLLLQYDR